MKNPLSLALMYEILRFTQNDSVARCPNGRDMPCGAICPNGRDMPLTGRGKA